MKCKCKAKPEPTVTWYRGQDLVEKSKKIKINTTVIAEDTYELTLEIKVKCIVDSITATDNLLHLISFRIREQPMVGPTDAMSKTNTVNQTQI